MITLQATNVNSLDGVATLSEGDLQTIFKYMKVAIQMTKLSYTGGEVCFVFFVFLYDITLICQLDNPLALKKKNV